MEFLISSYDNALIYYPNIFFPVLFLLCVLGAVFLIMVIISISKEFRKIAKEIKSNLSKVRTNYRSNFLLSIQTINFSFYTKFIVKLFLGINKLLRHFQAKIEKILRRIGKEILIDD
jgi:hypothetical protein